ncbi:MAG TPA: hypothetical protein VII33_16585, partial [Nakamurella sp.]
PAPDGQAAGAVDGTAEQDAPSGDGSAGASFDTNGHVPEPRAAPESAPQAPPRRRRAASRPAGPATGAAEPAVVTVPAEQGAW